MSGLLYVLGTPLGNLKDISERAIEVLGEVALIACEDTRRTGALLHHLGIANPGMICANEHREKEACEKIVSRLSQGDSVALLSDAGMPTISDPGALVVAAVAEAGLDITVIPGPTAVSSAIALSGFSISNYYFQGFLAKKGPERKAAIELFKQLRCPIVIYESPFRVADTIKELATHLGSDRRCAISREITKMHEQVWRMTLGEATKTTLNPKGEFVIVIDQAPALSEASDEEIEKAIRQVRTDAETAGLKTKALAKHVAALLDVSNKRVYELVLAASAKNNRAEL